jgi:hypothetical protein
MERHDIAVQLRQQGRHEIRRREIGRRYGRQARLGVSNAQ